jgi:hypothetical protein
MNRFIDFIVIFFAVAVVVPLKLATAKIFI